MYLYLYSHITQDQPPHSIIDLGNTRDINSRTIPFEKTSFFCPASNQTIKSQNLNSLLSKAQQISSEYKYVTENSLHSAHF